MRHASEIRQRALMKFLAQLANRLHVGRHVYIVGGAVRNFIINKPIKDLDIVVDSVGLGKDSDWFAERLVEAIPVRCDLTTNQYGVAIVTVKEDWWLEDINMKGEVIEIANARKESYGGSGGKGYKPHMVEPATIEEDVVRREFSFNTLLWRLMDLTDGPEKAEVIDLTGCGIRDLEEGVLRCPQDPDIVFSDDPTRLMRAVKFVAKYNFKIPADLATSIKKNAPQMKKAPWEAIGALLVENVLNEPTAREALVLMKRLGLLDVVAEIVRSSKPFQTYLSGHLRDKDVQLLLDLMDLGLDTKSPISFLKPEQQKRLREITIGMTSDIAMEYLALLQSPPVNNIELIDEFQIPAPERRILSETARTLMLRNPPLAFDPSSLQRLMEQALRPIYMG